MGLQGYNPNELVEILTPYFCLRGNCGFVPGYYTSAAWDGDAKVAANGIIDLSAVFGLPAGVKAVAVNARLQDETVGNENRISKSSTNLYEGIAGLVSVTNVSMRYAGVVPCDSNGDIYFSQSGETDQVAIYITGYWG